MKNNSYNVSGKFLKANQMLWKMSFLQKGRMLFYFIDKILLLGTAKRVKKEQYKCNSNRKKVLIVYNMALGDGIMFLGVADHFRKLYPKEQYELTIACQTAFKSLYEETGLFDYVLPFDFAGSIVNLKNRRNLFKKIREKQYDIVIDPVGCDNCTTNVFVTNAVIAKEKIGVLDCTLPHVQSPKWMLKKIYTKVIKLHEKDAHLIEFYSEFIRILGDNTCEAHPAEFPQITLPFETPERFFIIFPTASMAVKRWPLSRYAYLAKKIQEETGMPLVVCGTNHDKPTIDQFLKLVPDLEVIDYIGKTSIREFIELIGRAELVLTNDTSAYHIAVAKQCNVALICGGYTYTRYAHYDYESKGYRNPVLICEKMKCYDCNNYCKYNNRDIFPCIEAITEEKAWNVVKTMIEKR